ncbi:MAG TPA: Fic family protein [Candidatus Izemoplasmatales bacterium]|nr:Fic family protein [Candidatus Izemoplasmatales bacterium]
MKLEEVEALKQALLNKKNTMSQEELQKKQDAFDTLYIYESTSFDNDDFTFEDVEFLLEDHSRQFPDKKRNRRKAIINNYHALQMVHRLAKKKIAYDEEIVKDLHQTLVDGIISGGAYRSRDLFILGAKHVPPSYLKIYKKMDDYFEKLKNPELTGFERAAYALLQFLKIYPFVDANGRMARLILNYELELQDYLPVSISKKIQDRYFDAIDEYKINKDIKPFIDFIMEIEAERINEYIKGE